jgi:hypothetical protein
MRKAPRKAQKASRKVRCGRPQKETIASRPRGLNDLASRIRGLYGRVARHLDVDPSYVSRVARGERQSAAVVSVLRRELNKIVQEVRKWREEKKRETT